MRSVPGNVVLTLEKTENDLEHHRNVPFLKVCFGEGDVLEFRRIFRLIEAGRITEQNKIYTTEWEVKLNLFLCGKEVNFQIN